MKIIVSSTATQKIKAVEIAFQNMLSEKTREVVGYKSASGVNKQPVGRTEIVLGCENRLTDTMENQQGDIFISIESGIEFRGKNWYDFAYIIMHFSGYRSHYGIFTDTVIFPTEYVEEAMRLGFDKHTVGSVMANRRPEIDMQDPHLSLIGKSRVIYLADGIKKLIVKAGPSDIFDQLL
jgi:non-canonical (house-cleaning) NTP pyrophosphatase